MPGIVQSMHIEARAPGRVGITSDSRSQRYIARWSRDLGDSLITSDGRDSLGLAYCGCTRECISQVPGSSAV